MGANTSSIRSREQYETFINSIEHEERVVLNSDGIKGIFRRCQHFLWDISDPDIKKGINLTNPAFRKNIVAKIEIIFAQLCHLHWKDPPSIKDYYVDLPEYTETALVQRTKTDQEILFEMDQVKFMEWVSASVTYINDFCIAIHY